MAGFVDRVREEIDRGVASLSARSKALMETAQLRSRIRLLRRQREDRIRELGEVLYSMRDRWPPDIARVKPYFSGLEALDAEIAALEEQVRKKEAEAASAVRLAAEPAFAYCPRCGNALKETSRFCSRCGRDVTATVEQVKARRQTVNPACPSCGTVAGVGSKFCPNCGQALGESAPSSPGPAGG
jgi:RNA polymerase subunit RPABC4/transcription elongation factor Spt4